MNSETRKTDVSIGMPVYNGEKYLEETLVSVLNQTYSDFLFYISDNASTDRTKEICKQYALQDSRIIYIENEINVGAAGNYEKCFLPSTSKYFRWQNSDDTIEPQLIEKCFITLEENPDVVLAYGKSHIIDGQGEYVREYDDNLHLMHDKASDRFIACLTQIKFQNLMYGLMRREALQSTARMGAYVSADINLIAELTLYGKFFEIDEHLFNCRRHEDCSSWDMEDKEKLRKFWNPNKNKLRLQEFKSIYEYLKAVIRSPVPRQHKQVIIYYLIKYSYWRKKVLYTDVFESIKF